jgi:hypothetical protein
MEAPPMSRAMIIVRNDTDRQRAASWAMNSPPGCRIEFKESKRTIPQNSRLWAMLSEIASKVTWPPGGNGIRLTPDDYKLIFLDALKREVRMVPNLDGNGFVNLGRSSSDLSKAEMGDLFTLIEMFAAKHDVVFKWDTEDA